MKCLSLSGRSTLTYEVKDGLLTITGNSGRGLFKPTPVSMKAVDDGFVLAALKDLGAVEPLPENSRRFRRRSQV
jgi:hypothetical protein